MVVKGKDKASTEYMRENASLGLSIFLGGELNMCEHANLFIGPQIQFLELTYFSNSKNNDLINDDHKYPVSLGLKLGFRFH